MSDEENIIEFVDEGGNTVKFEFLDVVYYQDREFIVLLPVDEEDQDEVVIMEIKTAEGAESFVPVGNEDLDAVFEIFKLRLNNEEDDLH